MSYTSEELLDMILRYEKEVGESFLDRFDSYFDTHKFMVFCKDKGIVSEEKYNLWVCANNRGDYQAFSLQEFHTNIDDFDIPYSVVTFKEEDIMLSGIEEYDKLNRLGIAPVCQYIVSDTELLDNIVNELNEVNSK